MSTSSVAREIHVAVPPRPSSLDRVPTCERARRGICEAMGGGGCRRRQSGPFSLTISPAQGSARRPRTLSAARQNAVSRTGISEVNGRRLEPATISALPRATAPGPTAPSRRPRSRRWPPRSPCSMRPPGRLHYSSTELVLHRRHRGFHRQRHLFGADHRVRGPGTTSPRA
jgi:hypothetical protein